MTDDDLLRYSRHLLLDDVGIEGQQRLLDSHAVIVGAGGGKVLDAARAVAGVPAGMASKYRASAPETIGAAMLVP